MIWKLPLGVSLGLLTTLCLAIFLSPPDLTPKERYCSTIAGWHPDCNVE